MRTTLVSLNVTNADTCQLFVVIDLFFSKVTKKSSAESLSISSEPYCYSSRGKMNCRPSVSERILASIELFRGRFCLMQ